jgi:SPP1 gp7 family putative phage head morphogenesis protein
LKKINKQMTSAQRRTYSRKYQSMQKAIERKYLPVIYKALNNQVKAFVTLIEDGGDPSMVLFNEAISPAVRRLYLEAGLQGARVTRSELKAAPAIATKAAFGTNDELVAMIIDYLQQFLLSKSVIPISQTTREWVLRGIAAGVSEGRGALEIAKGLVGHEFLKFQALRIVRTETVRAANVGKMKAIEASPFEVQKEWIAAHDKRTRHSHRALDGQIREADEDFLPGLAQPGDPRASAALTINCRCTVASVAKRDAQGRLVRKPVQMLPPTSTTTIRQFLQAV